MSDHEGTLERLVQMREATEQVLLLADDNDEHFIAIKLIECLDSIDERVRLMTN